MSGPKSSRYTLTAERLRRIREEQERKRKALEEKARKERESKEAREYLSETKNKTRITEGFVKKYEADALSHSGSLPRESADELKSFFQKTKKLELLAETAPDQDHAGLMNARRSAETLSREIDSLRETIIHKLLDLITECRIRSDQRIFEGMDVSFDSLGVPKTEDDPKSSETIQKLEELYCLTLSEELRSEVSEVIAAYKDISDPGTRRDYEAITVDRLEKRCREYSEFVSRNADRFGSALDKYHALCEQLGELPLSFPFTQDGLESLEKTCEECEAKIRRSAEQSYIRRSIDEVMSEMGYEVIGKRTVTKKSGRSFRSKLLTYDDGTVVNVTESEDGRITMEIGGADDKDRAPDGNERAALQKKMESFCRDFAEIESKLEKRGVILDARLSMAPPEEAYAQIINISDYELVENADSVLTAKKRTASEDAKKHLRNE